jgi:hypothetical protein
VDTVLGLLPSNFQGLATGFDKSAYGCSDVALLKVGRDETELLSNKESDRSRKMGLWGNSGGFRRNPPHSRTCLKQLCLSKMLKAIQKLT